jgi:hypothetical protein
MQPRKQLKGKGGGYLLYLVEATLPATQWIKIGITTELLGRITGISCGCPIPIDVVWYRDVGDAEIADWAEKAVHVHFADRWSSGEWFEMRSDELLRSTIDEIIQRFAKPSPWSDLQLKDSPWRRPKNRVENLTELAARRAQGIERRRHEARETPFKPDFSMQSLRDVYKS